MSGETVVPCLHCYWLFEEGKQRHRCICGYIHTAEDTWPPYEEETEQLIDQYERVTAGQHLLEARNGDLSGFQVCEVPEDLDRDIHDRRRN